MNNVNSIINVNTRHLRIPLITLEPMQLCAYDISVVGVPDDIDSVCIVVYKPNGDHFVAYPLSQDSNGEWRCELLPTHFTTVGQGKYELIGKSCIGNTISLGTGRILTKAFNSGTTPVPTGDIIPVSEIPDATGVAHRIIAVNVGTTQNPDWTTQVEVN